MPKKISLIRILIISSVLLLLLVTPTILLAQTVFNNAKLKTQDHFLLLNSGLVSCEEAKVSFILWTEDIRELPKIETIIKETGLEWNKEILTNYYEKNAYKYTSRYNIKKEKEGKAVEILSMLIRVFDGKEVRVYFEERIDSEIDSVAYLDKKGIVLRQKVEEDEILSLSGYDPSFFEAVKIGSNKTNIQIITRNKAGLDRGKSVLAYPVLLEEF